MGDGIFMRVIWNDPPPRCPTCLSVDRSNRCGWRLDNAPPPWWTCDDPWHSARVRALEEKR